MSSEVAKITEPSLFVDGFYNRGGNLSSSWTISDGSATTFSEIDLEVETTPFDLVYSGDNLNTLKLRNSTDNANFAIIARFFGREDLQLSIHGRRQDSSNFISLSVDFIANTVTLSKTVVGVETILDEVEHTFTFEEAKYYSIDLWMFEDVLYGKVNKDLVVIAIDSIFMEESGFSIFVPSLNLYDPVKINKVAVHELIEQEEPQLEFDNSNLLVQFRKNMEEVVESPSEFTWETYRKAFKMWRLHKDDGYKDPSWSILGYPVEPPRTEHWFS